MSELQESIDAAAEELKHTDSALVQRRKKTMLIPAAILVGLVGWALWEGRTGKGRPFNVLPDGVTGKPTVRDPLVAPTSKRVYRVTSYPATNGAKGYHVAELKGANNVWIGYLVDKATGARVMFRASANGRNQLQQLLDDFNVQETAGV